jgi:ubiquinone/menaquinone biosynthesis C-methylase UbiE
MGDAYSCTRCGRQYPVFEGVPAFDQEGISPGGMGEFWDKGWGKRCGGGDQAFCLTASPQELKDRATQGIADCQARGYIHAEALPYADRIVLNIGCGGWGEAAFFTCIGTENYIGIDFSLNAARYSYKTIQRLGGKGMTVQGNAEALPISDSTIDVVFSNGVLHHTPKTQQTFDEVYRVLRPGGVALIGLYVTFSPQFIYERVSGFWKSLRDKRFRRWYNVGEDSWRTEGCVNPWTKTYSKRELLGMTKKYKLKELRIRKFDFSWGVLSLGRLGSLDCSRLGKRLAVLLSPFLGNMWSIRFVKE